MRIEMKVISVTEVQNVGKPTYNFVMTPVPDSEANKAVFGVTTPSAQLIVNNAQELPHGFGQTVMVDIGGDSGKMASPGQIGQPMRVPSRNRPQ